MKKAYTLLIVFLLLLSSAAMVMADGSSTITGLDAGIYFDLTDTDDLINGAENNNEILNGFTGYHYWTNVFFYIDKSINSNVHVGSTIKLEDAKGLGKGVFDVAPYVKWDYKPWTITASTHIGEKVGWAEDFDHCWWQVLENLKEPGMEINYEIKNGFNYIAVITTPEGSNATRFNSLNKLVYDHNGFRLGAGYQTDQRHKNNEASWGCWDVFTGFSLGEVKFDAEYQHRDFQTNSWGYTNYNAETNALLVNGQYKTYPWTIKGRYWKSFDPGFTTIITWHADPERLYFDNIDYDYNLYDRVRKYGVEAQIAGMEVEYKISSKRRLEAELYYAMDLGTTTKLDSNKDNFLDLSNYDEFSYKILYENKVKSNFTATYSYKVLNEAYQFNTKLEYKWAPNVRTNLEVGYGKTQKDVSKGNDDHLMWIARMLVTYI